MSSFYPGVWLSELAQLEARYTNFKALLYLLQGRLLSYMKDAVQDFPPGVNSLQVRQFSHGQSNPTYLVEVWQYSRQLAEPQNMPSPPSYHLVMPSCLFGRTPSHIARTRGWTNNCKFTHILTHIYILCLLWQAGSRKYVLRKKPPGKVLASAHAVEREFLALSTLAGTEVPVPTPRAICHDENVIGTPFYIMDHVQVLHIVGRTSIMGYFHGKCMLKSVSGWIRKAELYLGLDGNGHASLLIPQCMCQDCGHYLVLTCGIFMSQVLCVQGQIFVDPCLISLAPPERRAAYTALAKTLAALHSVGVPQQLAKFGRHTGYCSRQVQHILDIKVKDLGKVLR